MLVFDVFGKTCSRSGLEQGSPILVDCSALVLRSSCDLKPQEAGLEPAQVAPIACDCTSSSVPCAVQMAISLSLLLFCDFKIFFLFMSHQNYCSCFQGRP